MNASSADHAAPKSREHEVSVRDVTLRDGLQLTGGLLSVERKLQIVTGLLDAGVRDIEIGSLARPDLVPPLANTLELVAALDEAARADAHIWAATPRHVAKAVAAGVRNIQYCLSVSDAHNRANIGRDTETSMAALPEALEIAAAADASLQLCLATSFTCPFEGRVDPERVLSLVADPRADGCSHVVICDTLGQADPGEVRALVGAAAALRPHWGLIFHGHDTWGMGVANSLAAAEAGATLLDAALGGLGGCPFAPGASGNTSTEDLLFALKPEGLTPERLHALIDLGASVTAELGQEDQSKAARGVEAASTPFSWVRRT